jgi:hypothetical protein
VAPLESATPVAYPAMILAPLLHAYAIGERYSRRSEPRCEDDVACRVIAANPVPDHATLARFRVRPGRAPADPFADVLAPLRGQGWCVSR